MNKSTTTDCPICHAKNMMSVFQYANGEKFLAFCHNKCGDVTKRIDPAIAWEALKNASD